MINSDAKLFGKHLLSSRGLILLAMGGALGQGLLCQSAVAAPLAGNIISNMAVAEYKEEGSTVVQTARSNLVQTTIIPVYNLTLTANRSVQASPNQRVFYSHELTNTGNATDRYSLTASNAAGDNFDYSGLVVYLDANRDGIPDGNPITDYSLAAGESVGLLIAATVPAATTGNVGDLTITATSQTNNTITQFNTDRATVSNQAVILVRKSFSTTQVNQNQVVTVRLEYENKGGIASGAVQITDSLNAALSYAAGSENWNGTAVNPATGANDPAGIDYSVTANTITATLTNIPANSVGFIEFNVLVNQASAGQIPNITTFTYDHDNNTGTPNLTSSSNTTFLNVKSIYGVEINGISGSASSSVVNNLVTAPAVATGGEVIFRNYVWNTGNTEDRFNLTFTSNGFPTPHQIEFYRADGVTPLLDSNNDGIADTGSLLAGEKLEIVVKVRFPTTYADTTTTNYSVFPQAQSIGDSSKTNTVEDRSSLIVTDTTRLVDLSNRPENSANGTGNGNVNNAGNPWKTLAGNTGSTVVFPLNIKHIGSPTAYVLTADANGDFSTIELPQHVSSIRFYESTAGSCATLGTETGQTRLLNNGEEQLYCAVAQLDTIAPTNTVPVYFRVSSATYVSANNSSNPSFDTVLDAIQINSLNSKGVISLTPDLRGQMAVGGTVVYTHVLVNQTPSSLNSSYHFVVNDSQANFHTTLYYDSNDNGILDSTDPMIANLSTLSGGQLLAGQQIRLFAKVQNDGTVSTGVVDKTDIVLQDGANTLVTSVVDYTTVSQTQLRLTKLQAKDNDCNGIADGTYTTTTLTIARNANGIGQCVLYRVTLVNQGSAPIGAFNFHDATPAGTVMAVAPTCSTCTSGTIVSPALGQAGNVSGTLPSVASGQSDVFEFGVRYVGQ